MPKQTLSDDLRSIAAAGEELWIDPFIDEQRKGLEYAHSRIIEAADRIEEIESDLRVGHQRSTPMSEPIPPQFAHDAIEKLRQLREYEDAEKTPERMAKAASQYVNAEEQHESPIEWVAMYRCRACREKHTTHSIHMTETQAIVGLADIITGKRGAPPMITGHKCVAGDWGVCDLISLEDNS